LPAATVTEAGTDAELEELDKLTTAPPVGAGPLSVIVPVTLPPPTRLDVERDKPFNRGITVIDPLLLNPP
jgi:hypothetical protein